MRRRHRYAVAVAVVVIAATGCDDGPDDLSSPSPAATVAFPVDPSPSCVPPIEAFARLSPDLSYAPAAEEFAAFHAAARRTGACLTAAAVVDAPDDKVLAIPPGPLSEAGTRRLLASVEDAFAPRLLHVAVPGETATVEAAVPVFPGEDVDAALERWKSAAATEVDDAGADAPRMLETGGYDVYGVELGVRSGVDLTVVAVVLDELRSRGFGLVHVQINAEPPHFNPPRDPERDRRVERLREEGRLPSELPP